MANIATQRIQREFNEVTKSDEVAKNLIHIELVNNSLVELRGRIAGPPDTPYEGGTFHLEIKIPETYPFNPPKVSAHGLECVGVSRCLMAFVLLFAFVVCGV